MKKTLLMVLSLVLCLTVLTGCFGSLVEEEDLPVADITSVPSVDNGDNSGNDISASGADKAVAAAAFMPKDIIIIHAGDSRFYDYRSNGKLACLTADHTLLRKKITLEQGILQTPKENRIANFFLTGGVAAAIGYIVISFFYSILV